MSNKKFVVDLLNDTIDRICGADDLAELYKMRENARLHIDEMVCMRIHQIVLEK